MAWTTTTLKLLQLVVSNQHCQSVCFMTWQGSVPCKNLSKTVKVQVDLAFVVINCPIPVRSTTPIYVSRPFYDETIILNLTEVNLPYYQNARLGPKHLQSTVRSWYRFKQKLNHPIIIAQIFLILYTDFIIHLPLWSIAIWTLRYILAKWLRIIITTIN